MNKKNVAKYSVILSMFLVVMLTLTACGGGGAKDGAKTIRISHVLAEDHPTHTTLVDYFKKIVEEESNGALKVEVYPNAQLGSDRQSIEAVINGQLEMSVPGGPVLSGFYEPYMVYDLPFLFESREAAYEASDGELKEVLSEALLEKQGIRILGIGENGFRHITTSDKPVKTPEDLNGLKIRTMESPNHIKTFEALGANPTPMAFNELFTALQQGTVDGQENPIPIIYTSKLYEVQDYLTLDGHYYVNCPYIVNEQFWASLTPDEQEIVQKAIDETVVKQREELKAQDEKYLELIKESGTEVIELTEDERKAFSDKTASVYDWFVKTYGEEVEELINLARSYNK